ncbi:MAG: metal ABC transporter substrate-binding protein [Bacillota bacterium]|nr:metal ABC transporter substrate-binding protein [Bacillota bacterium]
MKITGHGRVISVLLVLVAFAIVLGLVVAALTIWPWPGRRSSPPPPGTRVVVASIFPLASLCGEIGGDAVQVSTLLPAGASPHTYEMTPSQARTLADADLVFQVGGGLDPFVTRLAGAAAGSARRLEAMAALPAETLLAQGEQPWLAQGAVTGAAPGVADPHIWLDPVLVRDYVVPALQEELGALWPEHAEVFAANAAGLRDRLTELDGWIREQLAPVREKGLITIHPAWGYFGRRYGIDTWAVEQHAGSEPSPLWLAELVDIARFRGIQTLFSEPQLSGQIAGILERELQVQVLVLDPLGGKGRPGYGSYTEMMRSNVEIMVEGLR